MPARLKRVVKASKRKKKTRLSPVGDENNVASLKQNAASVKAVIISAVLARQHLVSIGEGAIMRK